MVLVKKNRNEAKEQKGGFLRFLLGTLATSLPEANQKYLDEE